MNVIGIDRDGVINKDLGTYCYKIEDFEFIPGSAEAIRTLKSYGFKIVIITNQGGIEKGLYTQEDVDIVHQHMVNELGCTIDAIYNSTSTRVDDVDAKPNIGLFKRSENAGLKIDLFVGDKIVDLRAALDANAVPVLVETGYGKITEEKLTEPENYDIVSEVIMFDNLEKFVQWIIQQPQQFQF